MVLCSSNTTPLTRQVADISKQSSFQRNSFIVLQSLRQRVNLTKHKWVLQWSSLLMHDINLISRFGFLWRINTLGIFNLIIYFKHWGSYLSGSGVGNLCIMTQSQQVALQISLDLRHIYDWYTGYDHSVSCKHKMWTLSKSLKSLVSILMCHQGIMSVITCIILNSYKKMKEQQQQKNQSIFRISCNFI